MHCNRTPSNCILVVLLAVVFGITNGFFFESSSTSSVDIQNLVRILFYAAQRDHHHPASATNYSLKLSSHFGTNLIGLPEFRIERPTVLYLHGYIETPAVESVQTVVAAYRWRNDHNVLVLDWGALATGNYLFEAVANCRKIAIAVADTLTSGFRQGLPIDKLHLVGHSLGGQMAGLIGRRLKTLSNGRYVLPRISALDPANPPFYLDGTHLVADDARLVDVIHTDAWIYGAPWSTGSIDFWPNAGVMLQPGCEWRNFLRPLSENDLCSHHRSWRFWSDSLLNGRSFPAVRANSWSEFKSARSEGRRENVRMGFDCNCRNVRGDFYLQTNSRLPFGRYAIGMRWLPN